MEYLDIIGILLSKHLLPKGNCKLKVRPSLPSLFFSAVYTQIGLFLLQQQDMRCIPDLKLANLIPGYAVKNNWARTFRLSKI